MTKEYIKEGNELVGIFMGYQNFHAYEVMDQWEAGDGCGGEELSNVWILNPTQKFLDLKKKYFGFNIEHKIFDCETENYYKDWQYGFNYDSDWNSLMPVIDRIEELGYRFTISTTFVRVHTCKKSWDDVDEYRIQNTKISATFEAIVEFIKYYNDENTKG